jgi:hypothetical protein
MLGGWAGLPAKNQKHAGDACMHFCYASSVSEYVSRSIVDVCLRQCLLLAVFLGANPLWMYYEACKIQVWCSSFSHARVIFAYLL